MRIALIFCAFLLAACGGETPPPNPNSTPGNAAPESTTGVDYYGFDKYQVERLYVTCSVCHGNDGKKAFGGAKDLSVSELSFDARVAIIKYGRGKMTPYEGRMTDNEMRAVAKYIETFRP